MKHNIVTAQQTAERQIVEDWGSLAWLAGAKINDSEGLTLGRVVIHPGCCNPRHTHNNCDEVLYLMSGRVAHSIDDETVTLEAGDTLLVPAGTVHHAVSVGDVDADMIVAFSSGHRDFIPETAGESE